MVLNWVVPCSTGIGKEYFWSPEKIPSFWILVFFNNLGFLFSLYLAFKKYEWSKSEREKQILYINAYMWNLEKWYRWTGLQGRNRDTDVENKHMDAMGENGGGW